MPIQTELSLQQFLATATTPCVSLYLPIEANQLEKNRLTLRHLINHAKDVMATTWPDAAWTAFDAQLDPWLSDPKRLADVASPGLGLLSDGQQVYARALEYPVSEVAMVTEMPQVLPMLLDMQRHFEFDLLALQRDSIALYHNMGDVLTATELAADAPLTLKGTLGTELRGGETNAQTIGPGHVSYHGHNEKSAEEEIDQRRYYQAVDTYIADHFSKPNQRRLILFGLPQNLAVFREVSRNSYLSGSMQVELNPGGLTLADLDAALNVLRLDNGIRRHQKTLATLDKARGSGLFREDLGSVISALNQHAVAMLVIRQGARINARLDNGGLEFKSERAKHNNLLNDLADAVLAQGGEVRVLPENMQDQPVVAVLRYVPAP
ncbi:baeRF6 domain-containing protein [Lacticaseibacillus daqingensis]|uniref:baeRF6 domain-containing protein n=1 Tax=Lacticaseibacillus daqingensis TaxID=2486014 RepID=UPI000F779500|nr:hypothetical protein [Lacticaseibacillus daqingensis]